MDNKSKKQTTDVGAPVADNTNSMTAGERGGMMLQDLWHMEKLAHLIPECRMRTKVSGEFGTFTVTQDITQCTKANIFSEVDKKTEAFVRFSTVAGEHGAADAERINGFIYMDGVCAGIDGYLKNRRTIILLTISLRN